jgi:hypothetical protein
MWIGSISGLSVYAAITDKAPEEFGEADRRSSRQTRDEKTPGVMTTIFSIT